MALPSEIDTRSILLITAWDGCHRKILKLRFLNSVKYFQETSGQPASIDKLESMILSVGSERGWKWSLKIRLKSITCLDLVSNKIVVTTIIFLEQILCVSVSEDLRWLCMSGTFIVRCTLTHSASQTTNQWDPVRSRRQLVRWTRATRRPTPVKPVATEQMPMSEVTSVKCPTHPTATTSPTNVCFLR